MRTVSVTLQPNQRSYTTWRRFFNGFSQALVTKTFQAPLRQFSPPPPTEDSQPQEPQKTLRTSYVQGLSEKLERIFAPLGIRSIFTSARTLKRTLMRVKSHLPDDKRRGSPCNNCNHVYTGESKRTPKIRMAEHRWAVQKSDPNNGIVIHVARAITALIGKKEGLEPSV